MWPALSDAHAYEGVAPVILLLRREWRYSVPRRDGNNRQMYAMPLHVQFQVISTGKSPLAVLAHERIEFSVRAHVV